MKKYIITGGAGFIGSHIAEYLSAKGHHVIVLDSLRTGFEKNINGLNVQFEKGDIRDKNLVEELVQGANGIFHLAALVSVPESLLNINECIEINTLGTINILEAAKKNVNCKVVLSSSAANYGDNPILPKIETMTPEPMTPYAVTKLDGEFYLKMYQDQWGLPTASLRYFNVFGPRQNLKSAYAAAVPIFINNALQNKPITIFGDGLQTRDFIYVKDVVRANILASQKGNETYNVALGHNTSILELAEKIIEITNSKSKIKFLDERSGDIKHSKANPSKFTQLGFKPQYSIDHALKETIEFYHKASLIN
ncbi:NAD-dependent epimerase/dehydratase family protein [Flavobacterium sp. GSP27]|uniref:NAD-dependent epimerase/dehydratase family protein n=1 Tax=unclassified Flavobacterium TaxID=196869 RepID=UPI000F824DA6|nr:MULTISPECIES: NAD-dependent epimerase/dehydratase family protein [unclassified Flavobacterium]RTY89513.1 NAD-dependent epimerase/dehydratase family protein [Flavobacterium sp. GSN2]RTY78562.1 NAD-dependent epimerase/dehydratase family protein [Flavobacterium sp. LS1P28]RTY84782.1 NAD-dependent epimerase/dehydratase family protein [Flavobacterium sp. ZB4P23]RTY98710.1 NAD-dependent epimerase/dehydratase family protein [Flavobacterium sp. RSP49]RTZ03116.1 NAD-dependent epimerase/dehydratase f